jgi:hypothetical protein
MSEGERSTEQESLKDEMRNVIEEARMVLPGIQALFGFQTAAVFNQRFEELPVTALWAHLLALLLLALAIALVMTPAAYHRMAERGQVSRHLIDLSSRLIGLGMVPLMGAIALDVYEVTTAVLGNERWAVCGGGATLALLAALWFALPWSRRRGRWRGMCPECARAARRRSRVEGRGFKRA